MQTAPPDDGNQLLEQAKRFGRFLYRPLFWAPWVVLAACNPAIRRAFAATKPAGAGRLWVLRASALYFREGRRRVLEGDQRFSLEWQGKPCDYVEAAYLDANPDVAALVKSGACRAGIDHFMQTGLWEVLNGSRKLYGESAEPELAKRVDGQAGAQGKILCLFAHFDRQSLVDPYVIEYLKALRGFGCDIVFVSGSLVDSEAHKIAPLCREILVRNPVGYDFTSWYIALRHTSADLSGYESVLLANDSVYFPVCPAEGLMQAMEERELDLWGLTESFQSLHGARYHLQSYFLMLNRRAIDAGLLECFAERFETYGLQCRSGYIEAYEYGFTEMAVELGLKVGAFCSLEKAYGAAKRVGRLKLAMRVSNPTIHLWRQIVSECGCPALKVGLVRDNPEGYFNWAGLERVAKGYDLGLIQRHLKRVLGVLPKWTS